MTALTHPSDLKPLEYDHPKDEIAALFARLDPLTARLEAYTHDLVTNPFEAPNMPPEELLKVQVKRACLIQELGSIVYKWTTRGQGLRFIDSSARVHISTSPSKPAPATPVPVAAEGDMESLFPTTYALVEKILGELGPLVEDEECASNFTLVFDLFRNHENSLAMLSSDWQVVIVEAAVARLRWTQDTRPELKVEAGFSAVKRFIGEYRPGYCNGLAIAHTPNFGASWKDDAQARWTQLCVDAVAHVRAHPEEGLNYLKTEIFCEDPDQFGPDDSFVPGTKQVVERVIAALGWTNRELVEILAPFETVFSGNTLKRLRKAKRAYAIK